MKILHCSDLHLGRKPMGFVMSEYSQKRYEDYFRAFEFITDEAVKEKVDAVIVSGDLFDRKELSPDVLERTEKSLKKLKNNGIQTICVEGNHDRTFKGDEKSWLEYLSEESLIYFLEPFVFENGKISYLPWDGKKGSYIQIGSLRFYGVGYQGFQFPEYVRELVMNLDLNYQNIVLMHTSVGDPETIMGCIRKEDLIDLGRKCVYIAGGHIHTKQAVEDIHLFVPGAPEYWDIGERGEKGFFIYESENDKVTFHESKRRKKVETFINLNDGSSDSFFHELKNSLEKNKVEKGCLYVLNVRIPFGVFLNVDTKDVERKIEEMGALKAWVKIGFSNSSFEGEIELVDEVQKIEEEIVKENPFFASHSFETVQALNKLKTLHNSQNLEDSFQVLEKLFAFFGGRKNEDK